MPHTRALLPTHPPLLGYSYKWRIIHKPGLCSSRTLEGFNNPLMWLKCYPQIFVPETIIPSLTDYYLTCIVPETITQPHNVPETITQPPNVPETITQPSNVPETITQPPNVPETITQPPNVPETITQPSNVPETITQPPNVPETITQPPNVPETITQPPNVPETITQPHTVPETITQPPNVPETITQPHTVPETITQPHNVPENVNSRGNYTQPPKIITYFMKLGRFGFNIEVLLSCSHAVTTWKKPPLQLHKLASDPPVLHMSHTRN